MLPLLLRASQPAHVCCGSFSTDPASPTCQFMSASPRKRTRGRALRWAEPVIQASKLGSFDSWAMNDQEWTAIKPMLPNKPSTWSPILLPRRFIIGSETPSTAVGRNSRSGLPASGDYSGVGGWGPLRSVDRAARLVARKVGRSRHPSGKGSRPRRRPYTRWHHLVSE
jgi:hypothetical protein